MTRAQIRWQAHEMLERIEWLNTHAAPRSPKDAKKLETVLADLERAALKVIGTTVRPPV